MAISVMKDDRMKKVVNSIMHDYTTATGIACVFIDVKGKMQSSKYNFTGFCEFMRSVSGFNVKCAQCDLYGGLGSLKNQQCCPYRCHAGLVDFAVPIVWDDQVNGFIVAGQMASFDAPIPYAQERTLLEEGSYAYKYLHTVPQYTYDEIMSASRVLHILSTSYFPYDAKKLDVMHVLDSDSPSIPEPASVSRPEIRKTLEYIRRNLSGNLTLRIISEEVFLSESYLSKLFKQEMGMNLMEYINLCRVGEAEQILRSSRLPVDVVGRQVGYRRPSYFCKIFKKFTGTTPHVYRKKYEER